MKRSDSLARLGEFYDIVIVGGGATGLGAAVDAASRRYRVLLVEARDFAQGTSSRSTKLVHGGVRYLAQGNIRLVREALIERGLLVHNAPHLVSELRFLVPAYEWWQKPFYGVGLTFYDVLAGSLGLKGTAFVDAANALQLVPTLLPERLRGGVLYSDAQFNDTRLAISLARTAEALGATLLNYAQVTALLKQGEKLSGVVVRDAESGREYTVRARCVVNAAGVFCDAVRRLDDPSATPIVAVSQGIHLVLDRRFLPGSTAVMVPKTDDGRVFFCVPWQGRTLLGTTDTPVPGPDEEPAPLAAEVEFVLKHAGRYLVEKPTESDVLSAYAGLRPLVKGSTDRTSALSRDHTLLVSPSGLVSITGGKWTTYRRMAEAAVNAAASVAGLPRRACPTRNLKLYGAEGTHAQWKELAATSAEIGSYEALYPGRLHPRLPYTRAMAAFVIENEMPVKLEDVLSRRLRALILDCAASLEVAPTVARLMANLQGRDEAWVEREVSDYQRLASLYRLPTALSSAN